MGALFPFEVRLGGQAAGIRCRSTEALMLAGACTGNFHPQRAMSPVLAAARRAVAVFATARSLCARRAHRNRPRELRRRTNDGLRGRVGPDECCDDDRARRGDQPPLRCGRRNGGVCCGAFTRVIANPGGVLAHTGMSAAG